MTENELLVRINQILNMTTTRKVKRALLRSLGLTEKSINELCPFNQVEY